MSPEPAHTARRHPPACRMLGVVGLVGILAGLHLVSCVEIEPEPVVDQEGTPIALPGPADRWLRLESTSPEPGPIGLRPTFTFRFNDYLDADSYASYGFASLHSGGIRVNGDAFYRMTDKTVVWRPSRNLEPGLIYTLNFTGSLRSATGAPLLQTAGDQEALSAQKFLPTTTPPEPDAPKDDDSALPHARWADVAPIIDARCASCHADPGWRLNPLTYEHLVGRRSTQTELFLVRPGDPENSYLMQKILWDYPDIKFVPQPPPWSEGARELPREELLIFEGWIAHGAKP